MTFDDELRIFEFLKTVCSASEDGYATYKTGWNDAHVAEELGVPASAVGRIRGQKFGMTRRSPSERPDPLLAQLAAIEARVAFLENSLGVKK